MKSNPSVSQAWPIRSLLKGLVILVLGVGIGFALRAWLDQDTTSVLNQWQQQITEQKRELENEQRLSQSLLTQQMLDAATQQALEQSLGQKQAEIGQLKEQLAFYEHLLPLADKGAVQIRALDVEQRGDVLHYRLLLQRATANPVFKGHIEFTAAGQQDQDSVTIPLTAAGNDSSELAITFEQFLRTAGLLPLPPNFMPDSITMRIFEGKRLRATHTVTLTDSTN